MNTTEALFSIQNSLSYLLSDWILVATFFLAFVLDVFFRYKKIALGISLLGILISFLCLLNQSIAFNTEYNLFNGFYKINKSIIHFKFILTAASFLALLSYWKKSNNTKAREFYYLFPIFLWSANLLCMSDHMLSIFLGIEFLSILSYLYIAFEIRSKQTAESSSKYILYGAFSSAVMLYGLTWIYSISGSLKLDASFLENLSKAPQDTVALAMIMFLAGFLFKISAVPFHYYSPDLYEGSSAQTLSFISTIPKIAGIAVLYEFMTNFHFLYDGTYLVWPHFSWEMVMSSLAIATLFIGNLSALSQSNLKRIMAYSSISHTGFLLMGLSTFGDTSLNALYYYLVVFTISNFAVFFILQYLKDNYEIEELRDLVGYGKQHPWISSAFVLVLASLIGLPPFAGFIAKFFMFSAVFEHYQLSNSPWLLYLLIAGVINTVIALFYYLNIARHLFLVKRNPEVVFESNGNSFIIILSFILSFSLLLLGILPRIY